MGADAHIPNPYSHECTSWGTSGGGDLVITGSWDTGVSSSLDETPPPVFNGPVSREAQHPSIRATYGLLMAGDKTTPRKQSGAGAYSGWILGLLVGLAIGLSLGFATANMAIGIAIGVGVGIAFGLAFTRSKNAQDARSRADRDT